MSSAGLRSRPGRILGLKLRELRAMSQAGKIPGAAKIGRQWTCNLAKLRHYVEQQEHDKRDPYVSFAPTFNKLMNRTEARANDNRIAASPSTICATSCSVDIVA
jgi:hypothetical protein